jgi:lipoyl(octanoyl) transferase
MAVLPAKSGAQGAPLQSGVEWLRTPDLVPYQDAVAAMEDRAASIARGEARECVWLLEHPPLYTAGTSAQKAELLAPARLPVFNAGRGGRFTYHGPGQRVIYVMFDLASRGRDVRAFVTFLEDWLIATLTHLGVEGERHPPEIGVFVQGAKIASIGVRVRRWVTMHGASLNVAPELEHFSGIVPCGLADTPVTSLAALGAETEIEKVDDALRASFAEALRLIAVSADSSATPRSPDRPRLLPA